MVINNSDNRGKLARDMVDGWDAKDLVYYANSKMEDFFTEFSDEEFDKEWRSFYGLDFMTNREAMKIVLELVQKGNSSTDLSLYAGSAKALEAVDVLQDYMNDLMREEPATGCDYGIGG